MIPESERFEAFMRDVRRGKSKPMPPKEGPLWQHFLEWFRSADLGKAMRRADVWRAFSAGYQKGQKQN